eukprot:3035592-Pyramimonas_sp.AAC.1
MVDRLEVNHYGGFTPQSKEKKGNGADTSPHEYRGTNATSKSDDAYYEYSFPENEAELLKREKAASRRIATELGVREVLIKKDLDHDPPIDVQPPGAVRVLQWNVLADGLCDDGFLVRDVRNASAEEHGEWAYDTLIGQLQAIKARNDSDASIPKLFEGKQCPPSVQKNHDTVLNWKLRWARMRVIIVKAMPDIITLQAIPTCCVSQTRHLNTHMSTEQGNVHPQELDHLADVQKDMDDL